MGAALAVLGSTALAVATVLGWGTRARRAARRARRQAAVAQTAQRLDAAFAALDEAGAEMTETWERPRPAAALPTGGTGGRVPGRVALIDGLAEAVAVAAADGARLSAAIVDADVVVDEALADQLAGLAGAPVYLVGPRSMGVVLPGLGRAAALGVLAKIQAAHGFQSQVVEREADEDAVELVVRLLARENG